VIAYILYLSGVGRKLSMISIICKNNSDPRKVSVYIVRTGATESNVTEKKNPGVVSDRLDFRTGLSYLSSMYSSGMITQR
jgi:hypothetical protein